MNARNPLDWKLHCFIVLENIGNLGSLIVNLFTSRLYNQFPKYMVWKPDANSTARDKVSAIKNCFYLLSFQYDRWSIRQGSLRKCSALYTGNSIMVNSFLVHMIFTNVNSTFLTTPYFKLVHGTP